MNAKPSSHRLVEEGAYMAHRHYGVRQTKPPATDGGPLPSVMLGEQGTAHSTTIRGPDSPGSTPPYHGGRGPAWSARAFAAIILAIVAIALVIWFALGG
jgi:hypothetical protein